MLFLQGLILGFSIAAPVGPIGVLCMRRTLAHGRAAGFVSGLGAATADALYGSIAGFGLTAVANWLITYQSTLQLVGGLFLCYLGVKTWLTPAADQPAEASAENSLWGAYASTFFLTVTNPLTILSFGAMFAGLGLVGSSSSYGAAGLLITGVFLGSAGWWLALTAGVNLVRHKFTPVHLTWVNRFSGVLILGFGLLALLSWWQA